MFPVLVLQTLIRKYADKWHWPYLSGNPTLWRKVFYPHINDEAIDHLMAQIIKEKQT